MDQTAEPDHVARRPVDQGRHSVATRLVVAVRDVDPAHAAVAVERLAVADPAHRAGVAVHREHVVGVSRDEMAADQPGCLEDHLAFGPVRNRRAVRGRRHQTGPSLAVHGPGTATASPSPGQGGIDTATAATA